MSSGFRNRVKWVGTTSAASATDGDASPGPPSQLLTVDTAAAEAEHDGGTGMTSEQNPTTPPGVRGHADLRSPGVKKTPTAAGGFSNGFSDEPPKGEHQSFIPDFITQTDRFGNATTPRSAEGIQAARRMHPSGPEPNLHVEGGALVEARHEVTVKEEVKEADADAYETILDGFRMMCCCLLPDENNAPPGALSGSNNDDPIRNSVSPVGYSTRGHDAPLLFEEDSALRNGNNPDKIKLLPNLHHDDQGKKCLVLDLDETLVHSSFRAVPGADFVIPVQIDDVVHFVYVMKRPGVDEFLIEMAKHYEVVVYTASLNKYADPLLDLLDPNRVIRTRLFRESCVFYGGNYVKDMSLLNRDLSKSIIIDNSPSSYMFHPENAIDCTSFIDDPTDRELEHIGKFLIGIKDVLDVRGTVNLWRQWPNIDLSSTQT